jgi:hypothetical protein
MQTQGIAMTDLPPSSTWAVTICLYPEELDAFAPDQVGALARYEELGVRRCIVGGGQHARVSHGTQVPTPKSNASKGTLPMDIHELDLDGIDDDVG